MLELALPFCVGAKRVAELCLALSLYREHFAGVIKNGSGRASFGPRPFRVCERTERRRFFSHAHIARNKIRLFEGDVEPRVVREFEGERFLHFAGRRGDTRELQESANAMFEVDDEIAFVQLAEIDLGAVAAQLFRSLKSATTVCRVTAEQFRSRQDDE